MESLVSIVIPVYNADVYLERCLSSVDAQKYRPLEVVLVDDGSRDMSAKICDEYAIAKVEENDGITVQVLHQQNAGASIARKNGIAAAKGEYLSFIDADDLVSSDYISALYDALIRHNVTMSVCLYAKGESAEGFRFDTDLSNCLLNETELFNRFFKYEFWGFGGTLYKSNLFETVKFPQGTINEDYFVKAQLFCKKLAVAEVKSPLYFYEMHEGSLSNLKLSERALSEFDNACATWQYVKQVKPNYSQHALAIASEVACKWLGALNNAPKERQRGCLKEYRSRIEDFVWANKWAVFTNVNLIWKVRLVLLRNYIISSLLK